MHVDLQQAKHQKRTEQQCYFNSRNNFYLNFNSVFNHCFSSSSNFSRGNNCNLDLNYKSFLLSFINKLNRKHCYRKIMLTLYRIQCITMSLASSSLVQVIWSQLTDRNYHMVLFRFGKAIISRNLQVRSSCPVVSRPHIKKIRSMKFCEVFCEWCH